MPRGRLIFPFVLVIARLDVEAMVDDPGPGYDDDFREPVAEIGGNSSIPVRREMAVIRLRAQIEPGAFEAMQMTGNGNVPIGSIPIYIHMGELERAGLIDENGRHTIRAGDRLVRIENIRHEVVMTIPDPPGLYFETITSTSFGLGSHRPNLIHATLVDRPQGAEVTV
jgi:hypothetical protein